MLSMLTGLSDADVVFEPDDVSGLMTRMLLPVKKQSAGWHLIAHVTASSEEGASIAARLAWHRSRRTRPV